jgi:hypothetical protein
VSWVCTKASQIQLVTLRRRCANGPTVLCINDRPQALQLRKATLESHGYCANIASNGHTALKMLEETSVAAVLLEYKLEVWTPKPWPAISSNSFPTCRSSCFLRTPRYQSESCGWWMNRPDEERTAGTASVGHRTSDSPVPCCYFRVDHSTDPRPPAHQRLPGYDFGDW